jgi:hypothetical protein
MELDFSRRVSPLPGLFRHRLAPRPTGRPRFRPVLEALEGRLTPSTLRVTSTADDANQPGTLRYDVAHAQSGDTILLTGAVKSGIVLTQGELLLNQNVAVKSAGGHHVGISGGGLSRVFEVAPGAQVCLSNLILTGGNGVAGPTGSNRDDGHGGAILVDSGGTLTVNRSTLSANSAAFAGGAIESRSGTVNVNDSALSGNSAPITGGAINASSGTVNVKDSALSGNSSGVGGAISTDGTVNVKDSTLSGNSATAAGGAIFSIFGTATVSHSTLSDNSAAHGGAIANAAGTVAVSHSTLLNNHASGDGGAIFNNAGTVNVGTSKFSANGPDNVSGGFNDLGGNNGLS